MSYILLVEDNQNNADMVIRLLTTLKLPVRHVLRGVDGAKMARAERPLLILMDFNLPDVDGRTLTAMLKKQLGGTAAPAIIALTARSGETEEQLAAAAGCSAFITKPFDPEDFRNMIRRFLADQMNAMQASAQPGAARGNEAQ